MPDTPSHATSAPAEKPALLSAGAPALRILIAEDNASSGATLRDLLALDPALPVDLVADGSEALQALMKRPYRILVTDLNMPHVSGMELIEAVKHGMLPVAVIVTTGYGSIGEAVQAMRLGATDFLTKPIDIDHLRLVIGRVLREQALQAEVETLRKEVGNRDAFYEVLSKSPKMHAVFDLVERIAETASTVLIEGETGTGKEMIARAIHNASRQRTGPFVAINCAAVPETLLESELFGHEKGAFTSAAGQRKGRFELANGGTLFLDEVGDVPAPMQAKLLRVLQERRFERVGGTTTLEVDVRIVAATNRSLSRLVQAGKFREDLLYRLNVIKIELPPLRQRREDVPLLAQHFCAKYARSGTAPKQIGSAAMEILMEHRWPGNVRELENAIERASVTCKGEQIEPGNLPPELLKARAGKGRGRLDMSRPWNILLPDLVAQAEERYVRRALRRTRYNLPRTAKVTGLPEKEILDKCARYKIDIGALKRE